MNLGPTKYTQTGGTRHDSWRESAACRDHNPDIWFPDPEGIAGHGAAHIRAEREAIAIPICQACPVQAECLAWALSTDQRFGVWGGATEAQRETIRRRQQRNARKKGSHSMKQPCKTVGELAAALAAMPADAPIATLYDQQCDVKFGVTVHGMHQCDPFCDPADCPLVGHLVLDIDPRDKP